MRLSARPPVPSALGLVVAGSALAFGLTACGGNTTSAAPPASSPASSTSAATGYAASSTSASFGSAASVAAAGPSSAPASTVDPVSGERVPVETEEPLAEVQLPASLFEEGGGMTFAQYREQHPDVGGLNTGESDVQVVAEQLGHRMQRVTVDAVKGTRLTVTAVCPTAVGAARTDVFAQAEGTLPEWTAGSDGCGGRYAGMPVSEESGPVTFIFTVDDDTPFRAVVMRSTSAVDG